MNEVRASVDPSTHDYLTISEVAARFRVSERTVRRWIANGEIPAVRKGRSVRIPRSVFEGAPDMEDAS